MPTGKGLSHRVRPYPVMVADVGVHACSVDGRSYG